MEERRTVIWILYENTEKPVNQVWLSFPLSDKERAEQTMLGLTRGHEGESSIPFRIAKVESPVPNLKQYLPADGGLISLKSSNYKKNWLTEIWRLIFRFRRRVETVFSQLSEQLNAERVLAKSFRGLCTRLQNKVLGHNLCMAFNSIFRTPYDIGKIKQIIF